MRLRFLALVAVLLTAAGPAPAQNADLSADYPDRPVRFYNSGGVANTASRVLAEKLTASLGKPFVVETVAGAGGFLAATKVASSPPDGYTIFMAGEGAMTSNVALYKSLPYNPLNDFVHITLAADFDEHPGRQSGAAGEDAPRADRARQGAARQVHLCFVRLRQFAASGRRIAQVDGGRRHPACALSRCRCGPPRPDRRTGRHLFRQHVGHVAADAGGQGARARGDRFVAQVRSFPNCRPSPSWAFPAIRPPPGSALSRPSACRNP